MKEFTALRLRAKDRRDKAIAHARREYAETLIAIAALEQDLLGKESSRHKSISASIESCKRMGRLTYCFSKRWKNHEAALGLFFAHYNYCRKHRSL